MKTYVHTDFYANVHSSIIRNSQELKRTQMSMKWWMDEQIMVYFYNGTLLCNKKEQTTDTHNKWMNLKNIILSERSQTQKAIHDSIYMRS